jgi:hypothetical protein
MLGPVSKTKLAEVIFFKLKKMNIFTK